MPAARRTGAGSATGGYRAGAFGPAQSGAGHQYCGNQPHHRRRTGGGRCGAGACPAFRSRQWHDAPRHPAYFPRQRHAAGWSRRATGARRVLSPVVRRSARAVGGVWHCRDDAGRSGGAGAASGALGRQCAGAGLAGCPARGKLCTGATVAGAFGRHEPRVESRRHPHGAWRGDGRVTGAPAYRALVIARSGMGPGRHGLLRRRAVG